MSVSAAACGATRGRSLVMGAWLLFAGVLLVSMAVVSPRLQRVPITAPLIYLGLGVLLGPTCLDVLHIEVDDYAIELEHTAELALLISLFAAGIKMPHPFSWPSWRPPVLLATAGMVVTISAVAAFAVMAFDFSIGAAVLLGAALSPTDPVLATEVGSQHPGDRNHVRFTLTCEAGINDGAALPFALLGLGLLGLHDLGSHGLHWVMVDLLYQACAGVALGLATGALLGRLVNWAKRDNTETAVYEDFLGLGLITLVYGGALLIGACGFLAVFFAAVALRGTELRHSLASDPLHSAAPPEAAHISAQSLAFEERLSRVMEVILVLMLGGMLTLDPPSWRAAALAAFLFLVARPLGVILALTRSPLPPRTRLLSAWLGLRGIGSIYYVLFAHNQGYRGDEAIELSRMTLQVVALSILLHGITVTPLAQRYFAAGHHGLRRRKPA